MYTEDIKTELKQKERYISDLLRFIGTRTDNNPNYSLLLGSGCSVTSNVRSGGELISLWRKEIYVNLTRYDSSQEDEEYSADKAIDYLTKNCGAWYNKSNEYSSLFEKKYDLPRQRRMFVEKEVSDKTPSIGYAYLINLIKDSYFNTIFTTNFDDLINEAFYQFSDDRPMICAHDSSINSITVTSKRPKVIKLHGDYLFDDIKSTLRETESLEENIRNKFIEFAKDYGLIVIGYGGHDRSIMDVINYLLKHEDYYKNGIYWCLRKGDYISEELRKLLWKDKVYFVEIDGFDELFANMHNRIYKGKLPIDTNFISSKSQDIIQRFIENKYLTVTNSQIIKEDLKNLEDQNERNSFYETIKQMQADKDFGNDKLDNKEVKLLIELANLSKQDQYTEVLSIIHTTLENTSNKDFKIELYKKSINASVQLGKDDDAITTSNMLIEIDKNNPIHFINKSKLVVSFQDKIDLINKAIDLDSYYEDFYNKKVLLLIEKYEVDIDDEVEKNKIIKLLDKSLEVNPSINNSAWSIKFDFLLDINKDDKVLQEIIELLEKQGPYTINVLKKKYALIKKDADRNLFISSVNEAKNKYLDEDKLQYELLILNILKRINDKDEILQKFKELDSIKLYKNDSMYLKTKANILVEKFDRIEEGIALLYKSLEEKRNSNTVRMLVEFLLFNNDILEAKKVFNKNLNILSKQDKIHCQKDIYDKEKRYEDAYKEVKKLEDFNVHKKHQYTLILSYFLLQQEKFKDAKKILSDYLEKRNYSPQYEPEIINYEFASKKVNPTYTINKKRLTAIKEKTTSNLTKAAINALENNFPEMYKNLISALDKNYSSKYEFEDWPVFWDIREDQKFKTLLTNSRTNSILK